MSEGSEAFYGELIVVGTNGKLPGGNKGKKCNKIRLTKREKANGIRPARISDSTDKRTSEAVNSEEHHTVSYTVSRRRTIVVEYEVDNSMDMFQIGRSTDNHIDMNVIDIDLLKRGHSGEESAMAELSESTVSRYACRILVSREPPHVARVYAAGFDSRKNIFLGEKAIRWKNGNQPDGFTTNGVMIHHPQSALWPSFEIDPPEDNLAEPEQCDALLCENDGVTSASPQPLDATDPAISRSPPSSKSKLKPASVLGWREVSVCGNLFNMQSQRCVPHAGLRVRESNILRDGTLIDLCGVTLLWRSAQCLPLSASPLELLKKIDEMNEIHIQCPVNYNTLVLPRPRAGSQQNNNSASTAVSLHSRRPMVYLKCGHVHGPHNWKGPHDKGELIRTCPLCMRGSEFVALRMGNEPDFYVDHSPITHCFDPCGHMASENTVKYWCEMKLPNRSNHELEPKCPFCATTVKTPVKLIFP